MVDLLSIGTKMDDCFDTIEQTLFRIALIALVLESIGAQYIVLARSFMVNNLEVGLRLYMHIHRK